MVEMRLIDAVHDMRDIAMSTCNRIEDVASLLHAVGLEKLADRLDRLIVPLSEASKALGDAYGESISENLRNSQEMTGGLLLLALKTATEKAGAGHE